MLSTFGLLLWVETDGVSIGFIVVNSIWFVETDAISIWFIVVCGDRC